MKYFFALWLIFGAILFSLFGGADTTKAQNPEVVGSATEEPAVYYFGRDECGFCRALKSYLDEENISYTYLNIVSDSEAAAQYDAITAKHSISKVTPVIVIGEEVIVGFNGPATTGQSIKRAIATAGDLPHMSIEDHLRDAPVQTWTLEGGCTGLVCDEGVSSSQFTFELPYFGVVDLRSFSLISLSVVLGVIDGFNPCAMWVLITFLVLLSQAGSKKKMMVLAGIFILAQGIMYNLILNVWYKTWDFVALDQIVTPLVGLLALGGGAFFLWRWHKNKEVQLVCDITDIETQSKTINRFKQIVSAPITLTSIFAILAIAFSVNIIEFACSIGIPQAYTKILELNGLEFLERQWYILVFTLGYMFDDFIVFALAIWGYSRLQAHGGKYAQWSLLIGGMLMVGLGLLLVLNPGLLVL
jgi:glutaredoxin/uncharacterized protein (UPF0333 family)